MIQHIRDLKPRRAGQIIGLYKRDNGYLYVSTVNIQKGLDVGEQAIVNLAGMLGDAATHGEETMAFRCDENGKVEDWTEVAVANGGNSRQAVLDQLSEE